MDGGLGRIEGQKKVVYLLASSMERGRLHHAYRLEGPPGTGKGTTAMAVTATLNCLSPVRREIDSPFEGTGKDAKRTVSFDDACGECASCRKIPLGRPGAPLQHPDLILLMPEGDGKVIKVEKVREVQSLASYTPVEGRAKVVLLRDADDMTEEAANAFLKLLEEPPSGTYFFLTTSRPHKLLQTIRSRTVALRFSPLPSPLVVKILLDLRPGLDPEKAVAAASLGGGSVTRSLLFLDDWVGALEALKFVHDFGAALEGSAASALAFLDQASVGKENVEHLLLLLAAYYRDVAWLGVTGKGDGLILSVMQEAVSRMAETLDPLEAARICIRVTESLRHLVYNVSPRMIIEQALFNLRSW